MLPALITVISTLLLSWAALLVFLFLSKPRGSAWKEALRLLPDTAGLLKRLASDPTLPPGIRVRLWLLLAYLASPIDLIPDFIPVIGYADDAIIVCVVLRLVVRKAGPDAVRKHWQGSAEGLALLWRIAQLPGESAAPPFHDAE